MAKTEGKKKRTVKQKAAKITRDTITGEWISSSFFGRNKFTIILVIGMLMLYITYKYECQTKMSTISHLKKELSIKNSEAIRERSTYRSRTRESSMQARIDSIGLDLSVKNEPPFKISYDK